MGLAGEPSGAVACAPVVINKWDVDCESVSRESELASEPAICSREEVPEGPDLEYGDEGGSEAFCCLFVNHFFAAAVAVLTVWLKICCFLFVFVFVLMGRVLEPKALGKVSVKGV